MSNSHQTFSERIKMKSDNNNKFLNLLPRHENNNIISSEVINSNTEIPLLDSNPISLISDWKKYDHASGGFLFENQLEDKNNCSTSYGPRLGLELSLCQMMIQNKLTQSGINKLLQRNSDKVHGKQSISHIQNTKKCRFASDYILCNENNLQHEGQVEKAIERKKAVEKAILDWASKSEKSRVRKRSLNLTSMCLNSEIEESSDTAYSATESEFSTKESYYYRRHQKSFNSSGDYDTNVGRVTKASSSIHQAFSRVLPIVVCPLLTIENQEEILESDIPKCKNMITWDKIKSVEKV